MKIMIDIPDGKLCQLIKKGEDVYHCPCLRDEGAPASSYCGLYKEWLSTTNNSVRKCLKCKESN